MEPFTWFVPYIALGCAVVALWVGNTDRQREEHWYKEYVTFQLIHGTNLLQDEQYLQTCQNECEDAWLSKWISYAFALVFAGLALFVQP